MYRPDFEGSFGLGALLGAIVPASIAAAATGVVANCAIILLLGRPVLDFALPELLLIIVAAGIMIATAVMGRRLSWRSTCCSVAYPWLPYWADISPIPPRWA